VSESVTRTELLPMALLRQVRPGEALLVHNTLPPAHLVGRFWFRDAELHVTATGHKPPRERRDGRRVPPPTSRPGPGAGGEGRATRDPEAVA
jgi:type IV secretion system protein VirD4